MAKTVMSELVVRMTAETAALKAEMERVRRSVDTAAKNMSAEFAKSQKSVDSLAGGFKALGGIIAGVGFGALIQKIGQVSDNIAMFERGILVISPSLADAGKSMEFVSRLANQMGLGLQDVREGFIDLASATQGTVLAGEETRKIFESVTRFGDLLGKSTEKIKLGFLGISQMATLQTVSMEETRQVMENLGVSMTTIAKSIGMTTQEYKKNVKEGKVMASELLPALAKKMDELTVKAGATARTFGAAWNRMKNDWELFLNAVAQSGLVDALASAFTAMAAAIKSAQQPVVDFIRALVSLKAEIGLVVAALGTMFIISKVTAGFIALQAAIAGAAGVTAALTSLNAVAAVAFGPAGWIALGVGLLAGLVMNMNALKGQTVQLVGALSQADRMKTATTNIQEAKARMAELNKEYENLIALENANRNANQRSNPRIAQIQEELKTLQKTIDRFSEAETRWAADLAEGERLAAEEAARLKKELAELNEEQGKAGEAAKDTRSELEKLGVPYAAFFEEASKAWGVNEKVIVSIAKIESGFDKNAESIMTKWGKAKGVMQIIDATWQRLGGTLGKFQFDPKESIMRGTKHLAQLIAQFGDLDKAVAAYNAGEGLVAKLIKSGKYPEGLPAETKAYLNKFWKAIEEYGEGKLVVDAVSDAFKRQQEEIQRTAELMAELAGAQSEYLAGLWDDMTAAQMELLKVQDPAAYTQALREQERQVLETTMAKLAMADADKAVARAMLEGKFAAQDQAEAYLESQRAIEEATQMRQGWAQSVLQGFDQLWSNMISGAENAMEALQKTLKSWLYAIGQWLLKQTLIIPVTAALFGVSQQSLGGGLLGQLGGAGGTGGAGGATGGLGALSNIGKLFSGGGIAQGLNRFANWATGWANAGPQQTSLFGGANWGYGIAGLAGGFAGQKLFGGYGGMGGGIGSALGYGLGASSAAASLLGGLSWLGGPVGGILGMLAGGALGGMFGKEKIKGGVGYWNPQQGAGAAHGDTDQAVVGMMGELGKLADQFNTLINTISGRSDNLFGGGLWMDTNSKGDISAAYNSWLRGTQKADFKKQEEAAKWLAEQMTQDVTIAMRNVGRGMDQALQGVFEGLTQQMTGDAEASIQALQRFAEQLPAVQAMLKNTLPKFSQSLRDEFINISKWNAKSLEDVAALLTMAQDVQAGYADSLWEIYTATRSIQGSGETLTAAYERAAGQFNALRDAFLMIHGAIIPVNKGTILWADAMAYAAGGLDQLVALQSAYFENFYSDAERQVAAQKLAQVEVDKFNATLGLTGASAINTKEELRAYIESLNLGSQAGMDAYVAALKVAAAINTLGNAMNDAENITYGFVNSLSAYMEKALKPGDDIKSQEQFFFENFYSDIERQAAQIEQWKKQIADFNATLGLTGASAIDTKEALRAYIESLNLETDAGRKAYEQAMMLVSAILGLANVMGSAEEKTYGFVNSLSAYMEKTLKPVDDLQSQEQSFFENFYTDAEKQAAQVEQWKKQVAAFNATLGLTGASAIDTKEELRAYIESLNLETEAGRKAYEQAMKLVAAILGLTGAMGGLGESLTKIKEWAENAKKVSWEEPEEPPENFKAAMDKAWKLLNLSVATGSQDYIDQLAGVLDGLEQSAKQYIATLNNINKEFQNWAEEQRSFWFKNQPKDEVFKFPWLDNKNYADYEKRLRQSKYGEDWWQYGLGGHLMDPGGQQLSAQQASLEYYQKALQATDPAVFAQNFQDAWDFMLKSNALGGKAMLNPADQEKMLQWAKERMEKLTEQEKEKTKEQYKQLADAIALAIARVLGINKDDDEKAKLHATIENFEPTIKITIEDNREETTYTAEVD